MPPRCTSSSSTGVRMPGGEVVCNNDPSRIVRGKEEGAIGLGRRHVSYAVGGVPLGVGGKVRFRNITLESAGSGVEAGVGRNIMAGELLSEVRHIGFRSIAFHLNVFTVVNKGGDRLACRLSEPVIVCGGWSPYHRGTRGEGGRG